MKRRALLLLPLVLAACGGGGDSPQTAVALQAQQAPLQVFIFAGQSNMLGADAIISGDGVHDLADTGQQTASDRGVRFTMSTRFLRYEWGDIRGHNGYHIGLSTINGKPVKVHGPEVGFSRTLNARVAIIKYADNYTATENGRSAWVAPGSRWTAWQAFVDAQLAALGEPYEVAGFIWHQGIDDGALARSQADYAADLRQVAADLRAKYGGRPFVLARSVFSGVVGGTMTPIRAGQLEVAADPGNGWVDVDDLPLVATHHLTAPAQLVAGQRFAAEYMRLR